jgi:hypothetical protein
VLHLDQFALTGAGRALEQRIKALERPGHGEMKGVLLPSPDPDILRVNRFAVDSYMASALVESMREVLLEWGKTFTFETVMSHRSKVEILQRARDAGYRTYLYFVATEDVEINVARVANRVELGGHAVPVEKSGAAIIDLSTFFLTPSGTLIGPTFLTIPAMVRIVPGLPK